MDTGELRRALEDAGLSQYQAEAYVTLLSLGSVSATALADACSVPTARIYDVLRDLESMGYIETFEQGNLHARARNPQDVLDDLRGRATTFSAAANEIEERWQQPELDRHTVSIVKRFETVLERAAEAIRNATDDVQVSATPEQFAELRPALRAARESGAVVNVSLHTHPKDPANLPQGEAFEGVATEVRHRNLPSPFLALIDRTMAYFAPHAQSLNQYGVLVDDSTLSYVFHWYFRTCLWEVWPCIHDARPNRPPITYSDVRSCVRDVGMLVNEGGAVSVRVEGIALESGNEVVIDGTVADLIYAGTASPDGRLPLAQLAGQVALVVDAGESTYTVGGWGAVVEDIEAIRITVVDVTDVDKPTVSDVGASTPSPDSGESSQSYR